MIKEKIQEARNNPGALFGLLYPYILVIIIAVGLYFTNNLDFIARQNVPAFISDSTVITDLSIQPAKNIPPTNIFEVSKPSDELLSDGEKLFKANCSSCHGDNGTGGGPAAVGLNPAPKNFTDDQNWKNGSTISGIYTTLQEGIAGGAMVAYDYLLPKEKISLAHYIRETFVIDPPEDTQSDLEALDLTYNLSAGQQLPAQIPVSSAKLIMLQENESRVNRAESIYREIIENNSKSAFILKSVSSDLIRSISFLIRNNGWEQNERNFIDFVTKNVNQNGFNGRVYNLSSEEWSALFIYLNSIL
jgi:mono/diheme cytochrome c family protein